MLYTVLKSCQNYCIDKMSAHECQDNVVIANGKQRVSLSPSLSPEYSSYFTRLKNVVFVEDTEKYSMAQE